MRNKNCFVTPTVYYPMAEQKKTLKKIKRSSRPSATTKSKDEVIKGVAVEKPAAPQSEPPLNNPAKPQDQSSSSQDRRWSTMLASQSVTVVLAVIAFMVALSALAVSLMTSQQPADKTAFAQPTPIVPINGIGQADLDKLSQRLDTLAALIAQNTDHVTSLKQELAGAKAKRRTDVAAMTNLDDLMAKLAALETVVADQMLAPNVTDEPTFHGGFDTAQVGLLMAAGLLAENLAGRDIETWAGVLDDLQWPGVGVADRDIIRGAASTPVNSRSELLSLGRLQLAPMIQGLNKADDKSGLLAQARAQLANLIQLRRTDGDSDEPEAVLASFKSALDNADFDAAFAAARIWSSAGLDGIEPWLTAAQRRHDLDEAVNRLVAIFVENAAGQS